MSGKLVVPFTKFVFPLAKNFLTLLANMASASEIDGDNQRKMRGREVVKAGTGITLIILNEDLHGIIRIKKSLKNLVVSFDGVSETLKQEIKKQKGKFLGMLLGTLGASMLGSMLIWKGVIRAVKTVRRAGRWYTNMDKMNKNF